MPELRYNFISREWVIIAAERAKRPKDFAHTVSNDAPRPRYKDTCPFCPGNEDKTPPEVFRIPEGSGWRVRVIYNKFSALSPQGGKGRKETGLFRSMGGFGVHEVIVENPRHNALISTMSVDEVKDIIAAYKSRYTALRQNKDIEAIVIFKNHGSLAGTSLEHTHSQLIATPVVPPQLRNRMEVGLNHFDNTGKCIFCQTIEEELKAQERIIYETDSFISFMPYAALSPFHIWIFPRRHMSSFDEINNDEMEDLARVLKVILSKLHYGLKNPDFNYTIHSVPTKEGEKEYFHWYISVIPRLTHVAGFELGSGMFINVALPERSAHFLREVKVSGS